MMASAASESSWPIGNHVFISRAIQTDPAADTFAKKLSAKLEARSICVFSGKAPAGSLHVQHFERGARTSKVFVPIITTEFLRRIFTMNELDLALTAREMSKGRTKLIPLVKDPGNDTLRNTNVQVLANEWQRLARDSLQGQLLKVNVAKWQHNLKVLYSISREGCEEGESEEAFLDRCAESITGAMERDPFDREYDVFIAHAGDQKDFAIQLRAVFQQLGLRAFVDQPDLPPGFGNADMRMGEALREAYVGVAILSNAFFQKKAPMRELEVIVQQDNLLPVLWDVTYERMEKLCQDSQLLQREEYRQKIVRTTAVLAVEEKTFRSMLCQKVAFAALRRIVSQCHVGMVNTQAAYEHVKRLRRVLQKVVFEDDCMPDIFKKDLIEAVGMFRKVDGTQQAVGDSYEVAGARQRGRL